MISFNAFLVGYLILYLITAVADLALEGVNARHLKKTGTQVPQTFKGFIEEQEMAKITRYTLENCRFGIFQGVFSKIIFLMVILSGILPWLAQSLSGLNYLVAGLIFFALPGLFAALVTLPWDYYHSFVIEERYGFNTKTLKIWLFDLVKGLLLTLILGGTLLTSLLLMVRYGGPVWWIFAWGFFLGFQVLMTLIYPTVIAPVFNKFTPLEASSLLQKIEALSEKEGLTIKGIYKMDATRRSRHTNAYFAGLGRTKRIVLYDSLIASHDEDEIVAVLAHEVGHLKRNHVKKQLILMGAVSFLLFYLASEMIGWAGMFESFGFSVMPVYAGLFLLGVVWEPVSFFLSPLGMAISRKFEREADTYSLGILESSAALTRAFKKMAKENLSNLTPHPLYVLFNYSHPPLLERIKSIEAAGVTAG